MSERMEDIRNEDYVKLSAFYANPERFIDVQNKYTPGRADETQDYSWKEGSNTVKKALDRFEESYGGYDDLLEDARGFDKYSKSQFRNLNSTPDGKSPWVEDTAPFFEAFENYDRGANTRDRIKSLENAKPTEQQAEAEAPPAEAPSLSEKAQSAKDRVSKFQDDRLSGALSENLFGGQKTAAKNLAEQTKKKVYKSGQSAEEPAPEAKEYMEDYKFNAREKRLQRKKKREEDDLMVSMDD